MISIQFIVSIVLIISLLFVKIQTRYMQTTPLGFDKDNIAITEISPDIYRNHREALTDRLESFPGITHVSYANKKLCNSDDYGVQGIMDQGINIHFGIMAVSHNFLTTMSIPIIDGRNFTDVDARKQDAATLICNQKMVLGNPQLIPGKRLADGFVADIVGTSADMHFTSLRKPVDPFALMLVSTKSSQVLNFCYVKIKAGTDLKAAVGHINQSIHAIDPAYPVNVEFFDNVLNALYQGEIKLNRQITLFSLLAILISMIGVFGLVIFDTQYRRKEIGIRKVFGATVGEILTMFNRTYLYIVAVCFVIAVPVAWYEIKLWLQNFAYQTPIRIWVFAVALLAVLAVTILTVTLQSYRAATENPANSIKTE